MVHTKILRYVYDTSPCQISHSLLKSCTIYWH